MWSWLVTLLVIQKNILQNNCWTSESVSWIKWAMRRTNLINKWIKKSRRSLKRWNLAKNFRNSCYSDLLKRIRKKNKSLKMRGSRYRKLSSFSRSKTKHARRKQCRLSGWTCQSLSLVSWRKTSTRRRPPGSLLSRSIINIAKDIWKLWREVRVRWGSTKRYKIHSDLWILSLRKWKPIFKTVMNK